MVCLLLPQRLNSTWQAATAARSTPTTTPTTAPCPHRTWTNQSASSSTTRAGAHWASPLTTWCWSFTRRMGMMPSASFCCPPLTLSLSFSLFLSLFPPTPPLRHLIFNSYIWGRQHMHIKSPLPWWRIYASCNLKSPLQWVRCLHTATERGVRIVPYISPVNNSNVEWWMLSAFIRRREG